MCHKENCVLLSNPVNMKQLLSDLILTNENHVSSYPKCYQFAFYLKSAQAANLIATSNAWYQKAGCLCAFCKGLIAILVLVGSFPTTSGETQSMVDRNIHP